MLIRIFNRCVNNIANCQSVGYVAQEDVAINFRRVRLRPGGGTDIAVFVRFADFIDDNRQRPAHFSGELRGADPGCGFHQSLEALFLDLLWHRAIKRVGRRAFHRFEPETADPVKLRFFQPIEQVFEIILGLAGKPDNER